MKTKKNLSFILMAFVVLSFIGWTVYGQKPVPPKVTWEYKVVSETDKISLNDLGAQGWELVTVEMGGAQEVYYFKRMK
jgi:hypothetical protein